MVLMASGRNCLWGMFPYPLPKLHYCDPYLSPSKSIVLVSTTLTSAAQGNTQDISIPFLRFLMVMMRKLPLTNKLTL